MSVISNEDASLLNSLNSLSDKVRDVSSNLNVIKNSINSKKNSIILTLKSKLKDVSGNYASSAAIVNKLKSSITFSGENTDISSCISKLKTYNSAASILSAQAVSKVEALKDSSEKEVIMNSMQNYSSSFSDISTDLSSYYAETSVSSLSDASTVLNSSSNESLSSYDDNGLKHFMNLFIKILDAANVKYKLLSGRHYALDVSGNIVYGNAFVEKSGTDTFKTLDSDNKIYWFEDRSSRHYYGESIDIEPVGSGGFSDLLNSICLTDKISDAMHEYGLCVQYETLAAGAAAGAHFDISTEPGSPQMKWWSIVNKARTDSSLYTYSENTASSYYEAPTDNDVIVV